MKELAPCPFCGGEALIRYHSDQGSLSVNCLNVHCKMIVGTYVFFSEEEAITIWNTRANTPNTETGQTFIEAMRRVKEDYRKRREYYNED